MTYLGIDLSLTGTGLALLTDNVGIGLNAKEAVDRKLKHVEHVFDEKPPVAQPFYDGWLVAPTPKDHFERWKFITRAVMTLVKVAGPDVIAIEGYSFASKFAGEDLGELGGIVKFHLHAMGKKPLIVAPKALKKFLTGSGGSKKNIVLMSVLKRWGLELPSDDMADAFGLAKIGEAMQSTAGLPQFQVEVIEGIRNPKKKGST